MKPPKYGDRVSITITGTVVKDSPRFPTAAILVRLDNDHGGDTHWFAAGACTVIESEQATSKGQEP